MNISFAEHAVQIHSVDNSLRMEETLGTCKGGSLVVGEDAQQQSEYYCALIWLDYSAHRGARHSATESCCFGIGIVSEGLGLPPQVLAIPEAGLLVFGFNDQVMAFNVNNRKIAYQIGLDRSPFRSFLHRRDLNVVLVFHEIGLVAIGEDGRVLWRFDRDVITESFIDGQTIGLEFMDSPSVKLDLMSGSERA